MVYAGMVEISGVSATPPVVVYSPAVVAAIVGMGDTASGIAGIVGVGVEWCVASELTVLESA
jgi:hypothetical protein